MNGDKSDEGSGDDNLENFMTIDSVGDVEGLFFTRNFLIVCNIISFLL